MGQVAPVGDLAGDVVGDAADGEVRVGVLQDHGNLGARVQLAGPQGRADARVAAADHDHVHGTTPVSSVGLDLVAGDDDAGRVGGGDGGVEDLGRRDGHDAAQGLGADEAGHGGRGDT